MTLPEHWLWDTCKVLALQVSNAPIPDQQWNETTLPHQILLPDRAIWYAAKMIPPVSQYLYVSADDGAQIYFDGKHYPAINGYYYDLPESGDSTWLLIRVLNNAMQGGLKNAKWVSQDSIDLIWSEQNSEVEQLEEIYLTDLYHSKVFLPRDNFRLHDRMSTKFTCWGDSQGGWDKFQALINQMLDIPRLEYSIGLGDLVADGAVAAEWFSFLTCLAPLIEKRVNIFPIVGNHDYDGYYDDLIPRNYLRHIANLFGSTYTSWSAGPAFFLVLDANSSFPLGLDSLQYQWATQKMLSQEWQKATWRFVLIHQPPYAQGWSGYQGDSFIRSFIDFHAERHRIDFVLSGHCHDFEYLQKQYGAQRTHFVITGGGGGALEPKENDEVIRMDTVIKLHHYLLFDLDEKFATIQLIDDKNNVRWSRHVTASKP